MFILFAISMPKNSRKTGRLFALKINSWIYIIKGDMSVYLSVCLFVCLSVADGRPNGGADEDQTWHRDSCWPKECFFIVKVKVRVIYLCVRYNRTHACDTWRITMKHARSISSSSSSSTVSSRSSSSGAVAGATWWMLMKLLTEARMGRENSRAKRDSLFRPEDGYLQLVLR